MTEKIDLQELFYILMSSWIYSIEKTREELLGDNTAYTRRMGWNATKYIMDHLETTCDLENICELDVDLEEKSLKERMESILKRLESVGFIQEGTVTVNQEKDGISISMTKCRADACKELVEDGLMPQVCLRSIVLANILENVTDGQYTYRLEADPEKQPEGTCTMYLGDIS